MSRRGRVIFSLDIEASGRIPGPYWMCSFGLCRTDDLSAGFTRRLKPLVIPGLSLPDDPEAMDVVAQGLPELPRPTGTPPERAAAVRAFFQARGVEPRQALLELREWLSGQCAGARPILMASPLSFDFMWLYWYWWHLLEEMPAFGFAGLDLRSYFMGFHGVGPEAANKTVWHRLYPNDLPHTHDPLDDAREQGKLWADMVAARSRLPRGPDGLGGVESPA